MTVKKYFMINLFVVAPPQCASNEYPKHTRFHGEIGKNIQVFWLKKVPYLEL